MIDSNNQELMHHIHCLGYVLYHQNMIKILLDFINSYSMIFALDFIN